MKAVNREAKNPRDWKPAENLPKAIAALRDAKRILFTMHRHPDGDELGSALALACAMKELGKDVVVYNPDELPYNFRFLPMAGAVVKSLGAEERFDATVATDSGSADRLGPEVPGPERRGVMVNLDHHVTTHPFGDVNYVDPEAAAVGVLSYKIIRGLGHTVSRDAAQCIYASILADTGSFRYSSTDPESLRIAAELVEAGVEPWEMTVQVYEQQPLARMKLLAEVLSTLEVAEGGKLATLTITQAMISRTGTTHDLTDGFINHARSIDGVEVAASFTEPAPDALAKGEKPGWRVSFRSRGRVDVSKVAQAFGGGGHKNAAGCTVDGPEADVRSRIAAEIHKQLA
ncbi:MAG: bifunctional oligoribonuclease/PAP phosphatase NrnA [Deltaproteobacteria bacterium]|nr:bifunctional oligoribonuclease/PAP phosphatase NrnA [Deltaproteobacteria bacterium]